MNLATPQSAEDTAARVLGDFDLIERIGVGACGEVWRARQRHTERVLAIKLLPAGVARSAQMLWRFQREVEAAAQQEHPAIARIHASGATDDHPWYAMEFVPGVPLDQFVTSKALPLRETLRLFLAVCAGVQHAHDNGILHRDLKPANILVRDDGQPKILDFGLARFLDDAGLGQTLSLDGQPLGTPMFMAPEQAAGRMSEVGVAADVYALGVILYRLVTGAWPFDETLPPFQLLAITLKTDPRPPRAARPDLPHDLEAIILKALAKPKVERYPSVRAFTADLDRFLAGDPIHARRRTLAYVARKRLRKHWRGFAATTAIFVLFLSFAVIHLEQRRLAAARNVHALEQARELVNAMLFDLHIKLEAAGRLDLFAGLAEQAQKFPWKVDADALSSLDLRRSQALAATARGDALIGSDASKALEAYRQADTHLTSLAKEHPENARLQFEAIRARLGYHFALLKLGRHSPAHDGLQQVLAALAALHSPELSGEIAQTRAEAHRAAGLTLLARNRLPEAEADFEKALALATAPELRAWLHEHLGNVRWKRSEPVAALSAYREAEAHHRRLHVQSPRESPTSIHLARCLTAVAAIFCETNDLSETRRCLDEARDLCNDPGDHPSPLAVNQQTREIARGYHELSKRFAAQGRDTDALATGREALPLLRRVSRNTGGPNSDRIASWELQRHLGQLHLRLGATRDAARSFEAAVEHSRRLAQARIDDARWLLASAELEVMLVELPASAPKGSQDTYLRFANEHLATAERSTNLSEAQRGTVADLRARLASLPAPVAPLP